MGRRNRHRKGISIHTPLAGSDRAASGLRGLQAIISIHTPLAGSDAALRKCWRSLIFQSTLPLRGATWTCSTSTTSTSFQSTLPLRGATGHCHTLLSGHAISIHTPLAGSDACLSHTLPASANFNPHSPCGERPPPCVLSAAVIDFNPHSPCGERPRSSRFGSRAREFQSTLPLRGATAEMRHF